MRAQGYRLASCLGAAVAALVMTACGTSMRATSAGPPANAPTSSSNSGTVVTGPVLGAWWDSVAGGMRGWYGVAGAAWQGKPSFNDGTYSGATVCMRQQIALLITGSGALFLSRVPQGTAVPVANQGIANARIVFSPSCSAALAYAPGEAGALLVQGLPATPRVSSVALPAGTAVAALADSGSILVSIAQGGSTAIELLAAGSDTARSVTAVSKLGGMTFLPGIDAALVADQGSNRILESTQMNGNPSLTQVAGPADGVAQPVAIAASGDGRSAIVVNQKDSSVVRIDLTGQSAATRTVCRCSPTKLEALTGNLTFRVNDPGTGTVWAYDGDATNPRFVFLPSEQSAQGARP
jgi:hypothetical protein